MKRNANRLLSLVICFVMVLSMLPMASFAADTTTTTVYCQADWSKCNVYWWGSSISNPGWPGEAMTQDKDGIWAYDVPSDASNVIFNNGSTQTDDLPLPTDDNNMYVVGPNYWTGYGKVEIEAVYYVAGNFNGWNASAEGYQMIANEDGTYSLTLELAQDSYELKVTDGSWTNSWGADGGNLSITLSYDGEVTITFDPTSKTVTAAGDCLGEAEPLTITSLHLVGDEALLGVNWDPTANQMACAMGVYSITLTDVAAATYEYKFAANGGWDLSWGAGEETVPGNSYTLYKNVGNNLLVVAEDGSTVTFTFDMTTMDIVTGEGATCSVTVEAPAVEGIPLTLGDNALTLAAGDVDGDIWTYTATEDGTLSLNFTSLAMNNIDGVLEEVPAVHLPMVLGSRLNVLVNGSPVFQYPTTVAVAAGDVINIQITCGMGDPANMTLNLTMGEAQEVEPAEPGTADNPIVIETLPFEVTFEAVHDVFYVYTATEDGTLLITKTEGCYVSNLPDYSQDENDNYLVPVIAGQEVSINTWSLNNGGTYTINMQESSVEPEVNYYVAGTMNGWNAKADGYQMTANEDGTYTLTLTLAAEGYEFKVTNGSWDASWGENGSNVSFNVKEEGEVTITFDPATETITVSGDCVGDPDPLTITSVHLAGEEGLTGFNWDPTANQMSCAMGVYSITFTDIAANTYNFKFAANGGWDLSWASGDLMVSGESYTAWFKPMGNSSVEVLEDGSTVTLTLDMTSMDIFTGEGATCSVTVEAPEAQPSTAPTITIGHPTLSFEDVIVLNIYYGAENLDDVVEMGLITYSEKVENHSVETADAVIPGYAWSETEKLYYSSTNGIAAKDLGDTIYFAIYAKLADGTYTYTKLYYYSPKTYANNLLKTGDTQMKQIVAAMLNYGAAAQTYFNYNTDALVNADMTAEQKALLDSYSADMINDVALPNDAKKGEMIGNGGYTKRYPTISFEGAFCINYYFVPSAAPAGDITMYVWNQADYNAAESLSKDNATKAITMTIADNGEYLAVVDGIAAKNLDSGVYVAFCYSDGTTEYCSGVIGYSIGAYCKNQATKGDSLADLAAATAVYGYYAKQLFA